MIPSSPTICAFYTVGTPYEALSNKLLESIKALDLKYRVKGYHSRGSWVANCAIKPEFLLDCLDSCTGDLLYVDADALIRLKPEINCSENIGVYYKEHLDGSKELLSGTIYLKQTARPIIRDWITEQHKHPDRWDQKTLATILKDKPHHILPQGYTKIFDSPWIKGEEQIIYVEHFQASRTEKKAVNQVADLPDQINGIRLRKQVDGSFTISRNNRELEAKFDAKYIRVTNELRWLPYCVEGGRLSDLADTFKHKPCYIIGKGPSLDGLTANHFQEDVPIVCINESIHKIEELGLSNPTFCMQQDMSLKATCKPKHAKLLVAYGARNHYADFSNKIVFHMEEFGVISDLTAIVAMKMVQKFGCSRLWMYGFDSCTSNSTQYADCIGHPSTMGGDVKRFLLHKDKILCSAFVPIEFKEV